MNSAITGHTIYRCADNFQQAVVKFKPKKFCIIETATVKLTESEMDAVSNHTARRIPSYDSGLIYYLQFIPAASSVYNQLDNWMGQSPAGDAVVPAQQAVSIPEGYSDKLKQFLSIISDTAQENGVTPIIFYHPSEQLNPDGSVSYKTEQAYFDCFASTCEELDIVFVDMTDAFKKLYANEHRLAHGFINTAVGTGHLNKYGHHVIAEKLIEVIQRLEAQ